MKMLFFPEIQMSNMFFPICLVMMELVGEIIGLLLSPAKNVLSGLQGAGGKIAGILKTLEQRA